MKGTDTDGEGWIGEHGLDGRAGRVEKSKPEAERSRDVVEKAGKVEDLTGTGLKGRDGHRQLHFWNQGCKLCHW